MMLPPAKVKGELESRLLELAVPYLLPVVRERYRDAVLKEARRMEGEGGK
jgi:hypothetical protein